LLAEYPGPDFGDVGRAGRQTNAVFSFEPVCEPACTQDQGGARTQN
jgi:hypothetical protein